MYRLIVAILLLAVLACSALDIGRSEPMLEHHYAKWWIYLTHWALIACALQAWLAAIIVTKGLMIDRNEFGKCLPRAGRAGLLRDVIQMYSSARKSCDHCLSQLI